MFKLFRLFSWLILTLVILACLDQLMLRVPLEAPGVREAQTFYLDFRSRLLRLVGLGADERSIEQLIEASKPAKQPAKPQRYLYADEHGVLQFADSLEQVPLKYRQDAQPLTE